MEESARALQHVYDDSQMLHDLDRITAAVRSRGGLRRSLDVLLAVLREIHRRICTSHD